MLSATSVQKPVRGMSTVVPTRAPTRADRADRPFFRVYVSCNAFVHGRIVIRRKWWGRTMDYGAPMRSFARIFLRRAPEPPGTPASWKRPPVGDSRGATSQCHGELLWSLRAQQPPLAIVRTYGTMIPLLDAKSPTQRCSNPDRHTRAGAMDSARVTRGCRCKGCALRNFHHDVVLGQQSE